MAEPTFDTELLSDEEAEGLKTIPSESDEEEREDQPEKKIEEPLPPEKEKVVEPKPEEKPPLEVKPEEKPPEVKEKPQTIDGIIAKDGKNYIPFSVLEEERTRRQGLEAEIVELKKAKEPVKEPEKKVEPPPPPPPTVDFKALAKKAYESEEGMAEALQQMFDIGKKAGEEAGASTARSTTIETEFKREVGRIKGANPWIQAGPMEGFLFNLAITKMEERQVGQNDLEGMVKCAEDAVSEGKTLFRVDEPKVDLKAEIEKATKAAYDKAVKDVMAKFNIKEAEPVTLGDVRNMNPDVLNKFDELDKKSGFDYEEAYGQLTPEEKDAYAIRVDNRGI